MSTHPPCARRTQLVKFNADGSQERIFRCGEQTAPLLGKDVNVQDCTECSVRVEITRAATEYKPPRLAELRDIKEQKPDPNTSGWPKCLDRQLAVSHGCCGVLVEYRVCDSIDCFRMGAEVTQFICDECVFRRDT